MEKSSKGDVKKAYELLDNARAQLKELFPKNNHFDCALIATEIGNICLKNRHHEEAIEGFEKAVAILEKMLGDRKAHPLYLPHLNCF